MHVADLQHCSFSWPAASRHPLPPSKRTPPKCTPRPPLQSISAHPPASTQVIGCHLSGAVVLLALQVYAKLAGQYNKAQVDQAVSVLQNDAHLYTTIDDFHFKST